MRPFAQIFLLTKSMLALVVCVAHFPNQSHGLDERFDFYSAPRGLAMGNALVSDAWGYLATYYNPAGHAKMPKRRKEINLLAIDTIQGFGGVARALSAQSYGLYRLFGPMQSNPGSYTYFRHNVMPSFSMRGFSISTFANYQYAAESDGANIDINSHVDVGAAVGIARNFFGNRIKLGVTGKVFNRNELNGVFSHGSFTSDDATKSLMQEGIGIGVDVGTMLTFPVKYLPSFGLVYRDVGKTRFIANNFLNSNASGAPEAIDSELVAGFSIKPRISHKWRWTIAVDYRHILKTSIPWQKKLNIGVELRGLQRKSRSFIWFGVNQLFNPTLGFGLQLPGGNLLIGLYGEDVAAGTARKTDYRFFMRYTIGFF